jgi:DNA-binding NarL/FixJ family response regulator
MRVLLADDSVLFREGVARVLRDGGLEVMGQAGDVPELLALVRAAPPDAVVVDIRMPPTHTTEGLDAAARLRDEFPQVGVLVLSAHVEPAYALELVESGAEGAGYLLKDRITDVDELVEAVRRVGAGGLVIDPGVVAHLVGRARAHSPLDDLSDREREVLTLMAEGRSNQAICRALFLSPKTVEAYVRAVFTKLDLQQGADDNRRVLAVLAFLRG